MPTPSLAVVRLIVASLLFSSINLTFSRVEAQPKRLPMTVAASAQAGSANLELDFIPDSGIRVDNAANPQPGLDPSGALFLYYVSVTAHRELVATSADGLSFGVGAPITSYANDPRRTRLPDGTWRRYEFNPNAVEMRSSSSSNGVNFAPDAGIRYRPQTDDNGSLGIYDVFSDSAGGVVLLYLGDLRGLNNVRRAYSTDNGWTFAFERSNVLGDAGAGGGPNSYVDEKSIRLPDGRRRLFVMRPATPARTPAIGNSSSNRTRKQGRERQSKGKVRNADGDDSGPSFSPVYFFSLCACRCLGAFVDSPLSVPYAWILD